MRHATVHRNAAIADVGRFGDPRLGDQLDGASTTSRLGHRSSSIHDQWAQSSRVEGVAEGVLILRIFNFETLPFLPHNYNAAACDCLKALSVALFESGLARYLATPNNRRFLSPCHEAGNDYFSS